MMTYNRIRGGIHRYVDRDGQEISRADWTQLYSDLRYRRVGADVIRGLCVSTIWVGLVYVDSVPPYELFESMVFTQDLAPMEHYYYATHDAAVRGHLAIVARLVTATAGGTSCRS